MSLLRKWTAVVLLAAGFFSSERFFEPGALAASGEPVVFKALVPELLSGETTAQITMHSVEPVVYSVDLRLGYFPADAAVLETRAGPMGSGMTTAFNTNEPGVIRVAMAGTSAVSGEGVIWEIRFQALEQPLVWVTEVLVNEGAIPSIDSGTHEIAGAVRYYMGDKGVPGVMVGLAGDQASPASNANDGSYSFKANAGGNCMVTPSKATEEPLCQGVTTLDLALIRRHILATAKLDSPYKILAADVDDSGSVTTYDIALIRRFILGLTESFPAGLWEFIPSDFEFGNPLKPWPSETARSYTGLTGDLTGQDFVGIKHGDVNNSWTAHQGGALAALATDVSERRGHSRVASRSTDSRPRSRASKPVVAFEIGRALNVSGTAGERGKGRGRLLESNRRSIVRVPVRVAGFERVTSAQFTLEWDPSQMEYVSVSDYGIRGLDTENFGARYAEAGKLTFSWDDPQGVGLSVGGSHVLFMLELRRSDDATSMPVRFANNPIVEEVSVDFDLAIVVTKDGLVASNAANQSDIPLFAEYFRGQLDSQ